MAGCGSLRALAKRPGLLVCILLIIATAVALIAVGAKGASMALKCTTTMNECKSSSGDTLGCQQNYGFCAAEAVPLVIAAIALLVATVLGALITYLIFSQPQAQLDGAAVAGASAADAGASITASEAEDFYTIGLDDQEPCARTSYKPMKKWDPFAIALFTWFLAASAYYFAIRITESLATSEHQWYPQVLLAVEIFGYTAMLPYAWILLRYTTVPKLTTDSRAMAGDSSRGGPYTLHVLVPCYTEEADRFEEVDDPHDIPLIGGTLESILLDTHLPTSCIQLNVYLCDDLERKVAKLEEARANALQGRGERWTKEKEEEMKQYMALRAARVNEVNRLRALLPQGSERSISRLCRPLRYSGCDRETNGKSANLNHALTGKIFPRGVQPSPNDLVVVFDCDHRPVPHFFTRVLQVLGDSEADLLLTPQFFSNTYPGSDIFNNDNVQFWKYLLPGYDAWDYIACTGTNFCIKAAALKEAGWFPVDTVTEDYALSLKLKRTKPGSSRRNPHQYRPPHQQQQQRPGLQPTRHRAPRPPSSHQGSHTHPLSSVQLTARPYRGPHPTPLQQQQQQRQPQGFADDGSLYPQVNHISAPVLPGGPRPPPHRLPEQQYNGQYHQQLQQGRQQHNGYPHQQQQQQRQQQYGQLGVDQSAWGPSAPPMNGHASNGHALANAGMDGWHHNHNRYQQQQQQGAVAAGYGDQEDGLGLQPSAPPLDSEIEPDQDQGPYHPQQQQYGDIKHLGLGLGGHQGPAAGPIGAAGAAPAAAAGPQVSGEGGPGRKRFVGRYIYEHLATGLAPVEPRPWFQQRSRWTKGHFEVLFSGDCPYKFWSICASHPLAAIHASCLYMIGTWSYITNFISTPVFFLVPFCYLVLGLQPVNFTVQLGLAASLYLPSSFLMMNYCRDCRDLKSIWLAGISNIILSFTYFKAFLNTLMVTLRLKPKAGFKPTMSTAAAIAQALDPLVLGLYLLLNVSTMAVALYMLVTQLLGITSFAHLMQELANGNVNLNVAVPFFWAAHNTVAPLLMFAYYAAFDRSDRDTPPGTLYARFVTFMWVLDITTLTAAIGSVWWAVVLPYHGPQKSLMTIFAEYVSGAYADALADIKQ